MITIALSESDIDRLRDAWLAINPGRYPEIETMVSDAIDSFVYDANKDEVLDEE